MKIVDFPLCCTASIIFDFGGTALSAGKKEAESVESLRQRLKTLVDIYGCDLLVAITNSEQKNANKVLLEAEFEHTPWMSKKAHAESKIRLWWKKPK